MLLNEDALQKAIRGTSKLLLEQYIGEQYIGDSFSKDAEYDLFISHSYQDKGKIVELRCFFDNLGYSVYIDWVDDAVLDRNNVTPDTADTIRYRIGKCKALVYVVSENIKLSKWCPWELGFADGILGKVFILPIASNDTVKIGFDKDNFNVFFDDFDDFDGGVNNNSFSGLNGFNSFNGFEYLGLYPYLSFSDFLYKEPVVNFPTQAVQDDYAGHSVNLRTWLNSTGDIL